MGSYPTPIDNLVNHIIAGDYDGFEDRITAALKARREQKALTIAVGTRARLSNTVRPKYLAGVAGTIVGRKPKRNGEMSFVLQVDEELRTDQMRRFLHPEDGTITGPATLFEVVD